METKCLNTKYIVVYVKKSTFSFVSVQIQVRCLLLRAVGSAFIILCWVQAQVWSMGECTSAGVYVGWARMH